jgi:hypothetical protein
MGRTRGAPKGGGPPAAAKSDIDESHGDNDRHRFTDGEDSGADRPKDRTLSSSVGAAQGPFTFLIGT